MWGGHVTDELPCLGSRSDRQAQGVLCPLVSVFGLPLEGKKSPEARASASASASALSSWRLDLWFLMTSL